MIVGHDRLKAPPAPFRFNPLARYAKNAVLIVAPGYGDSSGGLAVYPYGLGITNTSFNGDEFGFYGSYGLRHIALNTGLTTAGTQLERIDVASYEYMEDALITTKGFTVRFLARIDNAGPSEFAGFGRVVSKQVTASTNTNFEIVPKADGSLKVERRASGTPNNSNTTTATGFYTVGSAAKFHWFVVTMRNDSLAASDIHAYVDGVEATSYPTTQNGGGTYLASDVTKPVHIGDRGNGSRECGVSLAYLDILNVPLSPAEVARSYSDMWDLVAPRRRRVWMPVAAAPVTGIIMPGPLMMGMG